MKQIALVAHDSRKRELIRLATCYKNYLNTMKRIYTTENTGNRLLHSGLHNLFSVASGPMGGDLEIGSLIVNREIDILIFLIDPLWATPHRDDIGALIRVSLIYDIPFALNFKSAGLLMTALQSEGMSAANFKKKVS